MDPNNSQQGETEQPVAVQSQPTPIVISPERSDPPAPIIPLVIPAETNIPTPENPKKSSPLIIIAIILAVVAVLAVVAYVFGVRLLTPRPPVPVLTSTPTPIAVLTPSPTATPDVTMNWKTYTNTIAGFGIKYPADWAAINVAAGSNGSQALPSSIMIDISKIGKAEAYPEGLMSIQIFGAKPSYPATFTKSTGTINNQVYEKYSTVIDQQLTSETYLFSTMDKKTFVEALIRYKTGDTYKETFDQILSTFKFIEATPTGNLIAPPPVPPFTTP